MEQLWDQNIISIELMHFFIILSFVALLVTTLFSGVINIGSHFSALELAPFQKYIIIFVSSNILLSLIYFISLADYKNASYLSLICSFCVLLQLLLYFYYIQPSLLLFEFKKNYTKLDSLIKKTVNKKDIAFLEEYRNIEDLKSMLSQTYRIKSYQVAIAYVLVSKKEDILKIQPEKVSITSLAGRKYNIDSAIVIIYAILEALLQIIQVVLVATEQYTKEYAVLIFGIIRIMVNLAFLIQFTVKMANFYRLLRKQNLFLKLSPVFIALFCFTIQKTLVEMICVSTHSENQVEVASIINFFMLSMENFLCCYLILQGFCFKNLLFSDYKSIITRIKSHLDVRITEDVPHAQSYMRYENEHEKNAESSLMRQLQSTE